MRHLKYFNDSNLRYNTFEDIVAHLPLEIRELLEGLKDLRERPDYHPEANAYEHVKKVTERLIPTDDPDLVMAAIFHDIGKVVKNIGKSKEGWPTSPKHPDFAAEMVDKYRDWIWWFGANPDNVKFLCKHHMTFHHDLPKMRKKHPTRREIESSALYNKLELFSRADDMINDFKI